MRPASRAMLLAMLLFPATGAAADFSIAFEWGDIPLCTSGVPNTVANPRFDLAGVPPETKAISFRLSDLDVPDYDHGGGTVDYSGQSAIESGAFTYKSPCPPSGSHHYRWTAVARKDAGASGGPLATATADKAYP